MTDARALTMEQIDGLVAELPGACDLRATGDQPFRIPWEVRSFALGIAAYTDGRFAWPEFQAALTAKIAEAGPLRPTHEYYARWLEAFESLVLERVGIDAAEVDRRTAEVLATPRDATHQHAHHDPVAVDHHDC